MPEHDPSFRLVRIRDGYPPLEDLGLIGDGSTVALAGLDGSIGWLCLPRFDSEPLLGGLLDREHGGHFSVTPEGLTEANRFDATAMLGATTAAWRKWMTRFSSRVKATTRAGAPA